MTMLRTEQNRTEQNRTEQNRTEQNRTEQNRTGSQEIKIGVTRKFLCIGILQQPIGTLQIPSRGLQRDFQICKGN
jgi:hypothetical protein